MREDSFSLLRTTALSAMVFGAAAALGFLFNAGRTSPWRVMSIVAAWVLAPFAALVLSHAVSKRWPAPVRQALYVVMLAVTPCSIAAYWNDFLRPHTPRAAVFVLVPGVSWVVIATVLLPTWLMSRRRT